MVSKKILGFGVVGGGIVVGAAAAFFTFTPPQGVNDDPSTTVETTTRENTDNTQTTPQPSNAAIAVPQYTFDDIAVTRPGGQNFTVTAVATCGGLAQDFNLSNTTQLAAFERACHEQVRKSVEYYACDRENFFPPIPTSNPELRARGSNRDIESVTEGMLWSAEEVASVGSRGVNSFTITKVSDIEAAASTEGFTRISNCGDVIFRGALPRP